MHYIFTAIGSYGDVLPMINIGKELHRRGHRVSIVTNPYFTDIIECAGLNFVPFGTREGYLAIFSNPAMYNGSESSKVIFKEGIANRLPILFDIIQRLYVPGNTIIAAHILDAASRILRELENLPVVSIVYSPSVIWSVDDPPKLAFKFQGPGWPSWWNASVYALLDRLIMRPNLAAPIDKFRQTKGLTPLTKRIMPDWWFDTPNTLCLFPDWFSAKQNDWPASAVTTGFPLLAPKENQPLPKEIESFINAGSKPIVFAPGSANMHAKTFFKIAVESCEKLGRRGILLTKFEEQLPDFLPEFVAHHAFIDMPAVLHHAAAFVHSGGIGASADGLLAGTPQLIVPNAHDQFDNAQRLKTLGVADCIQKEKFESNKVVKTLNKLLTSETIQNNLNKYAALLKKEDGVRAAADWLERMS